MNELDTMYLNAKEFLDAYNILAERFEPSFKVEDLFLLSPIVVNGSFAIELILKYIIRSGNKNIDVRRLGHEISILIDNLSSNYRDEIKNHLNSMEYSANQIENELKSMDRLCVSWRYVYENKNRSLDLSFFSELLKILEEMMISIHRDQGENNLLHSGMERSKL